MSRHEILCVNKSDRTNPHERITRIGGRNSDGKWWYLTQQQAVDAINEGRYQFFVRVRGNEVNVIVATSRYGNEYIKTQPDGEMPNNLLSLPECA